MSKLIDYLCNDKDYMILRGQKISKQTLLDLLHVETRDMEKDFRNMTENYWYAIRCWRNKSLAFDSEFDQMEKYCKDTLNKYNFI